MSAPDPDDLASAVADALEGSGSTVAVAESLTGGLLSSALARARDASEWFRGGVVAYASEVKFDVLDVEPGPVVLESVAVRMAERVGTLLGADVTVAVTGVGGPDPEEGEPPGTVWIAVSTGAGTTSARHRFEGGPREVCEATVAAALTRVLEALDRTPADG